MGREIGLGQVTHQLEIVAEDFGSLSLKEDFKMKTLQIILIITTINAFYN